MSRGPGQERHNLFGRALCLTGNSSPLFFEHFEQIRQPLHIAPQKFPKGRVSFWSPCSSASVPDLCMTALGVLWLTAHPASVTTACMGLTSSLSATPSQVNLEHNEEPQPNPTTATNNEDMLALCDSLGDRMGHPYIEAHSVFYVVNHQLLGTSSTPTIAPPQRESPRLACRRATTSGANWSSSQKRRGAPSCGRAGCWRRCCSCRLQAPCPP